MNQSWLLTVVPELSVSQMNFFLRPFEANVTKSESIRVLILFFEAPILRETHFAFFLVFCDFTKATKKLKNLILSASKHVEDQQRISQSRRLKINH